MGVSVDETGNQGMAIERLLRRGPVFGFGLGYREDIHDPSAVDGEGVMVQNGTLGLHRDDPARLQQSVDMHSIIRYFTREL